MTPQGWLIVGWLAAATPPWPSGYGTGPRRCARALLEASSDQQHHADPDRGAGGAVPRRTADPSPGSLAWSSRGDRGPGRPAGSCGCGRRGRRPGRPRPRTGATLGSGATPGVAQARASPSTARSSWASGREKAQADEALEGPAAARLRASLEASRTPCAAAATARAELTGVGSPTQWNRPRQAGASSTRAAPRPAGSADAPRSGSKSGPAFTDRTVVVGQQDGGGLLHHRRAQVAATAGRNDGLGDLGVSLSQPTRRPPQ